ncbi:hypothetical protein Esi_0113_0057 [Ectocarpus siliculosus]|uniref:Uncharacterized protein n=1 Tax=Ectocarpus siliculosus TaxID=2880 RepID=D8LD48_ECTSI|nr:hypothetical protein Esi_0113_0057 [Ectocarpus siliculosus]|eukprot:CBN78415.1 hypothetical protein Esi_0113_0057 [Ectocarpus siliculosus]
MAVFPRVQQQGRHGSRGGGRGTASSSSSSVTATKTTTPRRTVTAKKRASSSVRSSPRLHLTQKRTPANARRGSGPVGNRFASNQRQSTKAKGRTSSVGAHRDSSGGSTASGKAAKAASAAAGGGARKKSSPADDVAKVMIDLKGDSTAVIDKAMGKVEAECGTFVMTVLESCSAGVSGREEHDETAAAALREIETRQASLASRRSEMLKEVESNSSNLSAVVERCRAALDSLQQAESRKLKSGLDRATGTKS